MTNQIQEIVFKKIKTLTKKNFNSNTLISDLNIDSLDLVEMVTEFEEEYEVRISDEKLMNMKTIEDVINALKEVWK